MAEQLESQNDLSNQPQGVSRRWLMELDQAAKRDAGYLKQGKAVLDLYRGTNRKANSFNVLYSNTETLSAALYNAPPKPDVRRRFKDADPVAKAASQLLERAISFNIDNDAFDTAITYCVLDMILPGRGVIRVRYVPQLVQGQESADSTAVSENIEQLAWQQTQIEHVNWQDFRIGTGKTWLEINWIAFRHRMSREQLTEKFGEVGANLTLDSVEVDGLKDDDKAGDVFKTAEVWEIWCKDERKVYFICKSYKDAPLQVIDDPLGLQDFWPTPRPLTAICDSDSMSPVSLYEQYEEQAKELNLISKRITKLIEALRFRGVYDSTMTELDQLMAANDNTFIPSQNAAAWLERGGIDKAIWIMPIEEAARVLQILYQQRDASKQVIYEISGIADVMRGASDPNETLGAQQLKAKWGGQRINRMQQEVQRYARDLIRLMSEIIAEKFEPETLLSMTGLKIPSEQEVQMQAVQYQQQAQLAHQAGQQPPPQPEPPKATLEQVMAMLKDDSQRTFRIDVETDSMISAAMQQEAGDLRLVVQGVTEMLAGLAPSVQSGALPMDAAKEIMMAITRRAKMGQAVEDALEKMQAPKPPEPPQDNSQAIEQGKMQQDMQLAQMKLEANQAINQARVQADIQVQQAKLQADAQIEQMKASYKQQRDNDRQDFDIRIAEIKAQNEANVRLILAKIDAQTKIEVAEISAGVALDTAQINAANGALNA